MKEQSYISTSPVGRTACTEPQCLYKDALYSGIQRGFELQEKAACSKPYTSLGDLIVVTKCDVKYSW